MKIFIAHKDVDTEQAKSIARKLYSDYQIDSYLDSFDEGFNSVENLTAHLRNELGGCQSLLAVVSSRTRLSWWVPWEIGIATEKGHVIATYGLDNCDIPDYLKHWPYLKSGGDLGKYAEALKNNRVQINDSRMNKSEAYGSTSVANTIHRNLKNRLGQ